MSFLRTSLSLCLVSLLLLVGQSACSPEATDGDADGDSDSDVDADSDSDGDGGVVCQPEWDCCLDSECSDEIYCNGVEICDRGVCEPDPDAICAGGVCTLICDDALECTVDTCDEQANSCVYTPDDTQCLDDDTCNGTERCDPANPEHDERGCVFGASLICDDGDDCTDDYCVDSVCLTRLRDGDGDGHGDEDCEVCDPETEICERGDDCDDADDTVYPTAEEICDDGADNNCDRIRDYADETCVVPNDACADAIVLTEDEVVHSSTRRTAPDIDSTCANGSWGDVAFAFTTMAVLDVEIIVEGRGGRGVNVALSADCGNAGADLGCQTGREFTMMSRSLPAGTYYIIISAELEADFDISYTTSEPVERPDGDQCATAEEIAGSGTSSYDGETTDCDPDYETRCGGPTELDTTYVFTLAEPRSLEMTLTGGTGPVSVAIQGTCGVTGTERTCFSADAGEESSRYFRALDAGTYYLVFKTPDEDAFEFSMSFGVAEETLMEPWIDTSGHPTLSRSAGSDDDGQYNFDLGTLAFPFNDTTYGCVSISTNGYLRFGPSGSCPSATSYSDSTTNIDDAYASGNAQVSWLGDDGYAGSSVTGLADTAGNRAIITYLDYHGLGDTGLNDIQIILNCDTGDIQISYNDCTFDNSSHWAIGVSEPAVAGGSAQPHDFTTHGSGTVTSFGPGAIHQAPEHSTAEAYLPLNGRAIFFQRSGAGWDLLVDDLPL